MTRLFHTLVCIGGITSLSLTFFHPAMWAPVGMFLGFALLLVTPVILAEKPAEPPGFFLALIWIGTTALLALAYGFTEELFNVKQVALMLAGLLFGYFMSLTRAPPWVAWAPFGLFALYFTILLVLGREPGDAFSRNSQNYVSVILLALYVSAIIMTRPSAVRIMHVLIAGFVLILSVWAAGRGGILASLLLVGGLFVRFISQGRPGIIHGTIAAFMILAASVALFFAGGILESQGYLYKFEGRGLHDASRLSIIISYFDGIEISELLLGKNYYDDSFMARWNFNLHNSYLDAWAHLTLYYLMFIVAVLVITARRLRRHPVIVIAVLAFAARAVTDSQMFSGQYDYVIFATLFVLLREPGREPVMARPAPSPSRAPRRYVGSPRQSASDEPGT
ncbi:MAG: hypothetical protein H0W33_06840 [Gammaproteobacteria bacterium]|nr:hypothetical protein [Gammaproteobacteria bacterium]